MLKLTGFFAYFFLVAGVFAGEPTGTKASVAEQSSEDRKKLKDEGVEMWLNTRDDSFIIRKYLLGAGYKALDFSWKSTLKEVLYNKEIKTFAFKTEFQAWDDFGKTEIKITRSLLMLRQNGRMVSGRVDGILIVGSDKFWLAYFAKNPGKSPKFYPVTVGTDLVTVPQKTP